VQAGAAIPITFAKQMKASCVIVSLLFASVSFCGAAPEPPTAATLAAICKVPETAVARTVKLPDIDPMLKGKMVWLASYAFSQPVDFGITLACVPHGRLKQESFSMIATRPELEYKKIELADGSVIHHNLGDRGDQGTFYSTALVTKNGPYDYTLLISRKPGVKDEDLPIDITSSGIDLIQQLTKQK
jgi:hypothetical protein